MSSQRERRGAHRPGGLGLAGALPWVLAAVAVVVVVAVASGLFGGSGGAPAAVTSPAPKTSPSRATTPSGSATAKATPSRSVTTPANGGSATASTSSVDRTLSVTVLNGTSRSGLAARAATTLRGAGWTIRGTGNSTAGTGATTVYYGQPGLRATAAAVAAALGGSPQVTESTDFGSRRITVVLASDFTG